MKTDKLKKWWPPLCGVGENVPRAATLSGELAVIIAAGHPEAGEDAPQALAFSPFSLPLQGWAL